jgi:glycine betaine catabolism A
MDRPAPLDRAALERVLRPRERARTLPGSAYCSAAVFDWEQRHLVERGWFCIGRAADLGSRSLSGRLGARSAPRRDGHAADTAAEGSGACDAHSPLGSPGDQRAVRVGSTGILLVRGDDGVLRGFFNACRHRGHELLEVGAGRSARGIKCPYHSWVYGLAGDCRATPRFEESPVDRAEFGLVPVRVASWHGWVFANVSGDAPAFERHAGNLDAVVADYRPADLVLGATREYEVAANWKVVVENYLECYHCPSIHPELCRVTPPESDRIFPQAPTGVWVGGPMDLREGAATMSLTGASDGVPIATVPEAKRREVGYAVLLPNLLLSLHPDYVMAHRLVPLAPDRTWIECAWHFPAETLDRPGFSPDYAADFWDVTNRQDWRACESVQRNAASPGFRQGPFSPWESDVWREMTMMARAYLTGRLAPFEPVTPEAAAPARSR